jgi:hypothetical protein
MENEDQDEEGDEDNEVVEEDRPAEWDVDEVSLYFNALLVSTQIVVLKKN